MKTKLNFIRNDYRVRLIFYTGFIIWYDCFEVIPFLKESAGYILITNAFFNTAMVICLFFIYRYRHDKSKLSLFTELVFPLILSVSVIYFIYRLYTTNDNKMVDVGLIVLLLSLTVYFITNSLKVYKQSNTEIKS